jgi:hypothetical protein
MPTATLTETRELRRPIEALREPERPCRLLARDRLRRRVALDRLDLTFRQQ